ncbi:Glycosyl hydrolases family 25 [Pseudobutyrivibrio sp. 49]|uniref:GH25 family lysozyme n=1 Tax=Pseudobutyrivibrio sp. 49 TaxID=1855344 RepID=UPI000887C2A3|nr:GH25 family lysozyme [Pseudobutyrivibrio sp. 49]SDH29685.1 Glycosyl hydrolases family 25 [Pseudobutyrivibrio sp. 49]
MKDFNHFDYNKKASSRGRKQKDIFRRRILIGGIAVGILFLTLGTVFIVKKVTGGKEEPVEVAEELEPEDDVKIEVVVDEPEEEPAEEVTEDTEEEEKSSKDPQVEVKVESGANVDVGSLVSASTVGENSNITYGIDVSKFQGTIDWTQVASSGINFAMIRVGYRDSSTGEIKADSNAKYNMQEAEKNGIKIGAYFFSTAINSTEANEEATWVANYIAQYPITYPVGYNCEGFENSSSRQYNLTKDERSAVADAFLDAIYKAGYTPIFYASKNELTNDAKWNASSLEKKWKIWMAWYNQDTSAIATGPAYSGKCAMWQYTNQGTIPGISKKVDVDVAYFGYNGTETAKDTSERAVATADVEALMKFDAVDETVTAKSKTNLRDKPSQGADSTVKVTLINGQTATRTGVSKSGWSRVVFEGGTYYAVSSYLTTDLSAAAQTAPSPTPETATDAAQAEQTPATTGFKTKFTDCNELITAKEIVNLRSKPSVTDADSQVVITLYNGMTATRTGINNEYGWSRIDYNGQTLYCVSSYIKVVE